MIEINEQVDYPAAHSTDTRWFGIDDAGEVASFFSDYDNHSAVPKGLPHAGGSHDFAWPYNWPELPSDVWNALHQYAVTDDSQGIYVYVKSPTSELPVTQLQQKVDSFFLQPLPTIFRESAWIVPQHFFCCELFGESFGPFPLGELSQVAFVDLAGKLSPLPKSVGDPRLFFTRLADLAIWSAQFGVPLNRVIRGLVNDEDYWRLLRINVEELQSLLTAAADRGDEQSFEHVAAGLENLLRLYERP